MARPGLDAICVRLIFAENIKSVNPAIAHRSIVLEHVPKRADASVCRDILEKNAQNAPLATKTIPYASQSIKVRVIIILYKLYPV